MIVVWILLGVALLQIAIWVPLVRSWRKKRDAFFSNLDREIATSGEKIVIPRERANYEGASDVYGATRGSGVLLLTDERLVFRKLTGGVVEIPVAKMTAVRESKTFLSSAVGGNVFLVVGTTDPAEVGFIVTDRAAWRRALEGAIETAKAA